MPQFNYGHFQLWQIMSFFHFKEFIYLIIK